MNIARFKKRIGTGIVVHPKNFVKTEEDLRIPTYMLPFALKDSSFLS